MSRPIFICCFYTTFFRHVFYFIFNFFCKIFSLSNKNAWYKGKKIATILGYKNTSKTIKNQLKDQHKKKPYIELYSNDSLVHNELNTIYINEPELYLLIFKSKMKIADTFNDWVTEEVLPSIHKHEEYKFKQNITEQLFIKF